MPSFNHDGLTLHYEQSGARANPTVLLIHGFTCQLVHWPAPLVEALTGAGYRVVTFDNRDVGRSSILDDRPVASIEEIMAAPRASEPVYSLADLAGDAEALLDHLGQSGAHVVGFSMGGMVAQQMALQCPERLFSIVSIGSSTSDPDLPGARREVFDAFISTPPANRRDAIAHLRKGWQALGGEHYDSSRVGLARLAEKSYDRGYSAAGAARQLLAILHARPRGEALAGVDLPALVIHGAADPLVPVAAGERTAACLPGASLCVLEDLGHDLPDPLLDAMASAMITLFDSVPVQR